MRRGGGWGAPRIGFVRKDSARAERLEHGAALQKKFQELGAIRRRADEIVEGSFCAGRRTCGRRTPGTSHSCGREAVPEALVGGESNSDARAYWLCPECLGELEGLNLRQGRGRGAGRRCEMARRQRHARLRTGGRSRREGRPDRCVRRPAPARRRSGSIGLYREYAEAQGSALKDGSSELDERALHRYPGRRAEGIVPLLVGQAHVLGQGGHAGGRKRLDRPLDLFGRRAVR